MFLVRVLVDANKHRMLWGADWLHTPSMTVRGHDEAMRETSYLEVDGMFLVFPGSENKAASYPNYHQGLFCRDIVQ